MMSWLMNSLLKDSFGSFGDDELVDEWEDMNNYMSEWGLRC
jgi:hypothetical protein